MPEKHPFSALRTRQMPVGRQTSREERQGRSWLNHSYFRTWAGQQRSAPRCLRDRYNPPVNRCPAMLGAAYGRAGSRPPCHSAARCPDPKPGALRSNTGRRRRAHADAGKGRPARCGLRPGVRRWPHRHHGGTEVRGPGRGRRHRRQLDQSGRSQCQSRGRRSAREVSRSGRDDRRRVRRDRRHACICCQRRT